MEEKLKGYKVGGDDYLTKPFDDDEVLVKIEKNLAYREDRQELKKKAESASDIAFHALNEKSNIGVCLRFLEAAQVCDERQKIIDLICSAANALGLQVNVQVRGAQIENFTSSGQVPELEAALLERAKDNGVFVPFGRRLIVNEGDFSLLAKNMPEDDSLKYEMLKQHMHTLLKGGYARYCMLNSQQQIQGHRDMLSTIISNTHSLLKNTDQTFRDILKKNATIMEEMAQEMESKVLNDKELSEELERSIHDICEQTVNRMNQMHSQVLEVDNNFSRIVEALQQAQNNDAGRN